MSFFLGGWWALKGWVRLEGLLCWCLGEERKFGVVMREEGRGFYTLEAEMN